MKDIVDNKLSKISDIWNNYIWEYKFCNKKIKFTDDVKSNYFGDILKYFGDTFEVIYEQKKSEKFSDNFESAISFLQAIYIQQDFVEELLHIFKTNIDKGDLLKDPNYQINRDIRNELVGHPIRKGNIDGKNQLISSTIFSNSLTSENVSYLKYDISNNYKFKEITVSKSDIVKRHTEFLIYYFDIIIERLKSILKEFLIKISEIENCISNASLESIINITSHSFEHIFKFDYLYNPITLIEIYKKQDENKRYKNTIIKFISDLETSIIEVKNDINDFISYKGIVTNEVLEKPIFNIDFDSSLFSNDRINEKISYHYELSKLASKRDFDSFDFFSSILRSKCADQKEILTEIDNMEKNLSNDIEYYCSYFEICRLLKE